MHYLSVLVAALYVAGGAMADRLRVNERDNKTLSFMRVDRKGLTPREIAHFEEVDRKAHAMLVKRGGVRKRDCIPQDYKQSILVGDGDPHQNFYYQQGTGVQNCAGQDQITLETSVSWSWSASIEGAYSWISGGFSVEESFEQGQSETAVCSDTTESVCIWQSIAHTAYTVQSQDCTHGCGLDFCDNDGDPVIFFSPNSNQYGGCFYTGTSTRNGCENAVDKCTGEGTGFWMMCGPEGGDPGVIQCGPFQTEVCGETCSA